MPTTSQPTWIALAGQGDLASVVDAVGSHRVRLIEDADAFQVEVASGRFRGVIVVAPPADEPTIELVAKERRRRQRLRTLLLSDRADIDRRVDALRRGFDEALPTDTDAREVVARLLLLDEQASGGADARIRVAAGVVLDTVAHELRRDGVVVHVRPKEYQLLNMLASHPGRAYSRRQLIDRVWGHDHDGDPRTVDVHVRWLRSKIEPDPESPVHLVTVRGVGYRLDPDGP